MHHRWLAAALPALALGLVSAWAVAQGVPSSRYVPYQGRLELAGEPVDEQVAMTRTLLNTGPDGTIGFRVNNANVMTMASDGSLTAPAFVAGTSRFEGFTTTSYTASGAASSSAPSVSDVESMTPVASSVCFLTRSFLHYVGSGPVHGTVEQCFIENVSGTWRLTASATLVYPTDSATIECAATCLQWDQ